MDLTSESDFLHYIKTEIDENRLRLPTLPDIALKVREMLAKDEITSKQLADLIATDTALSARLIQVVNSPLYRGWQEITSLQTAVSRLGHKALKLLVTSLVIQQMFTPPNRMLEHYFRKIWEQSVRVSAMSKMIAEKTNNLDPDQAMLAGLIHSIGKLPILVLIEKNQNSMKDRISIEGLTEKLHPVIGKMIMEAWDFPDSISKVAWEYREFERKGEREADYVDVVQVAYIETVLREDIVKQKEYLRLRQTCSAYSRLELHMNIDALLTTPTTVEELEANQSIFDE